MKKLIFDLDNTLLFVSKDWSIHFQKFINKYNLNITLEHLFNSIEKFEKNNSDIIVENDYFLKYLCDKISSKITEEMMNDLINYYADIPLTYTDVVYDILNYLSQKYELIAYTNWFTENQIKRLKKYNLDKFFSKIYGWDILPVKPSKRGLEAIIKDKNIEDFIFIGDSIEYDLELPNSIGIDTIFYNRKGIVQDKYKDILGLEELKKIL